MRDIAKADAPATKRQTDAVPGKAGDVPREFATLHNYLTNLYADIVVLTFDQIEGVLGFRLPDAARTQEEWWTGTYRDGDEWSCSDAWILAGMTARPNLLAQTVVFECEKGILEGLMNVAHSLGIYWALSGLILTVGSYCEHPRGIASVRGLCSVRRRWPPPPQLSRDGRPRRPGVRLRRRPEALPAPVGPTRALADNAQ